MDHLLGLNGPLRPHIASYALYMASYPIWPQWTIMSLMASLCQLWHFLDPYGPSIVPMRAKGMQMAHVPIGIHSLNIIGQYRAQKSISEAKRGPLVPIGAHQGPKGAISCPFGAMWIPTEAIFGQRGPLGDCKWHIKDQRGVQRTHKEPQGFQNKPV